LFTISTEFSVIWSCIYGRDHVTYTMVSALCKPQTLYICYSHADAHLKPNYAHMLINRPGFYSLDSLKFRVLNRALRMISYCRKLETLFKPYPIFSEEQKIRVFCYCWKEADGYFTTQIGKLYSNLIEKIECIGIKPEKCE
jgi:hypothetical protein